MVVHHARTPRTRPIDDPLKCYLLLELRLSGLEFIRPGVGREDR
jgi:hypothetical protein